MERWDVIIVGAGPAGCATALSLLREQPRTRIAVFDRAALPRVKPCGGAVSRAGLEVLDELGVDRTCMKHAVPIGGLRVRCGEHVGEHHVASEDEPLGWVVERRAFDGSLVELAQERGVHVFSEHKLVQLERQDAGHVTSFEDATGQIIRCRAPLLVGADGTGSAVRRLHHFGEPSPRARAVVVETPATADERLESHHGGIIEFDLSVVLDGVPGYAWHFAASRGERSVVSRGVYVAPSAASSPAQLLSRVLERRGVAEARGTPYSERVLTAPDGAVARWGAVLVGEAAGFVDPVTGEGIAQALRSGAIAGRYLAEVLQGAPFDAEVYRRRLFSARFHRHLRTMRALAHHAHGPMASRWARALARSKVAIEVGARWYAGEHTPWLGLAAMLLDLAKGQGAQDF